MYRARRPEVPAKTWRRAVKASTVRPAVHPTDTKNPQYFHKVVDCQWACPAGDMSPNPPAGVNGPQQFGEALADVVVDVARSIETAVPEKPSIKGRTNHFLFGSRIDFRNKLLMMVYSRAFFPELAQAFSDEWAGGVAAESNTILLNGELAMVSGSGEFFSNHANRLRERTYLKHAFFFGYANGHNLYFPTIEATSEGGYGASPEMSPVEIGAGEKIMNQSLLNIYASFVLTLRTTS